MFREVVLKEPTHNAAKIQMLPKWMTWFCGLSILGLCAGLVAALVTTKRHSEGLQQIVSNNIQASGVDNPVTAVLLNFRSYDTLLEIGVLLIVAIVMLPSASKHNTQPLIQNEPSLNSGLVMSTLLRFITPILIVVGGYMLWTGAYSPGGAFQAGALIAGAGILIFVSAKYRVNLHGFVFRVLLSMGLAIFILSGFLVALLNGQFLQYPQEHASLIILFIETAATVSIATTLVLLYLAVANGEEHTKNDT